MWQLSPVNNKEKFWSKWQKKVFQSSLQNVSLTSTQGSYPLSLYHFLGLGLVKCSWPSVIEILYLTILTLLIWLFRFPADTAHVARKWKNEMFSLLQLLLLPVSTENISREQWNKMHSGSQCLRKFFSASKLCISSD